MSSVNSRDWAQVIAFLVSLVTLPGVAQAHPNCASALSDSDGDGYGWENGKSCLVTAASAQLPLCATSESDSDGDGYGWENEKSCKVADTTTSLTNSEQISDSSNALKLCENSNSDPDGDGYGWEHGESCRVTGGRPVCRSVDSDSDGDGFGWEDDRTCIVEEGDIPPAAAVDEQYQLDHPACSDPKYDEDGDGYGWENSTVCTNVNFGDAGASITDLVLITGQSNALGAETVISDVPRYDEIIDSPVKRVYAYTNTGWTIAGLRQIWDRGWYPRSDIVNDPANNFAFHFAKQVVRDDSTRVVGIILITAPGHPIAHWDKGGEFFLEIAKKVQLALDALPHKDSVDAVLWHQGESDYYDNQYYEDKLFALISNFRSESWIDDNAVFICGETLNAPVNARLNRLNSDGDPQSACVSSEGLESLGDDIHFSADSLRQLGVRYATKYYEISAR